MSSNNTQITPEQDIPLPINNNNMHKNIYSINSDSNTGFSEGEGDTEFININTSSNSGILSELVWDAEADICLFDGLNRLPPVGANRPLCILNCTIYVQKCMGKHVTEQQVYDRVNHFYNLEALEELDPDLSVTEFSLPGEYVPMLEEAGFKAAPRLQPKKEKDLELDLGITTPSADGFEERGDLEISGKNSVKKEKKDDGDLSSKGGPTKRRKLDHKEKSTPKKHSTGYATPSPSQYSTEMTHHVDAITPTETPKPSRKKKEKLQTPTV